MLIGEYKHTMDDKNRISLPAKFRKEMGKKLVVTYGLDNCLFIFTEKEWNKLSAYLSDFSLLQSDNRSFNRFMFGGAAEAGVDSIGRIRIPDHLKNWGSLKQKAIIIGVQNRLEIWSEEKWKSYKKQVEKKADGLAEKLGGSGVL